MDSLEYVIEAQIVFVQVGQLGIFKKHSSKDNMLDKYYSTEEVIAFMNNSTLKVCIVDNSEKIIESNF